MTVAINKAKICVWILGALGIVVLLIGIIALSVLPSIYKKKVQENIILQSGKETFEKWRETPIAVSFTVYLFNCTNPEAVQERGEKPVLEEVGPYVFSQQRSKEVLSWDEEEHTVTYRDMKTFHFIPELSADPDQKLYTLNMPLMGIVNRVRNSGFFKDLLLDLLDKLFESYKENLFTFRTPRELLFGGYKVDMVADLLKIARQFVPMPDVLPNNTFGYFYDKNNTGAGILTVHTGADDITKFSQIASWNYRRHISDWNDKYCGMINGTDGSQFAPPVTKYETLYVFTPEICRSVRIDYVEEVSVRDILAYRFMPPDDMLAGASENPDNRCFCLHKEMCNVSGLIDVSRCREGLPIFVSGPHFYKGHLSYKHGADGLSPNEDEHESFVDIEPTTGVVLRASRKFQLNYLMEPYDGLPQTKNAPKVLFPLMWLREEAEINTALASAFTAKVKTPATVAKSVLTACIVLGILWIIIAGLITVYIVFKQKKSPKKDYQSVPLKPIENGENPEKLKPVNT